MRTSRLRTYAPMRRQSLKVKKAAPDFQAVYRLVDQRSEGRCEADAGGSRCPRRATDHHHTMRPRRGYGHQPQFVIHLCRACHDRTTYPFKRGRLLIVPMGDGQFLMAIRHFPDKFAARQPKAAI